MFMFCGYDIDNVNVVNALIDTEHTFPNSNFEFFVHKKKVEGRWNITISPLGYFAQNKHLWDQQIDHFCKLPVDTEQGETSDVSADPMDFRTYKNVQDTFLNAGFVENINLPTNVKS